MTNIVDALVVVAEVTGSNLSAPAIKAIAMDLMEYPTESVLKALHRCQRELKGRLTLADIRERIDSFDGHAGDDEAWAIACNALDENVTVILTNEIAQALEVAKCVLPDKVGARMAFKAAYARFLDIAKQNGLKPKWFASLGHDKNGREEALKRAVELGRLQHEQIQQLLPAPPPRADVALLIEQTIKSDKETALKALEKLKKIVKKQ